MLADDIDPGVRYQVAFTLGEVDHVERIGTMSKLFVRDGANQWVRVALLSSVRDDAGRMLASLLRQTAGGTYKPKAEWLEPLAEIVGRQRDQAAVTAVAQALAACAQRDKSLASRIEAALNRGIEKTRKMLASNDAVVQPIVQKRTDREAVLKKYEPALKLEGSGERGRAHFRKLCAQCHKAEGEGRELGPSLPAAASRGTEFLLTNIIDPNRAVNPQFVNYTATMKDGQIITGIITAETATSVTLTRAEGMSDTVLRIDIDELTATGLSLMPEGLEQGLQVRDVADLIAYLKALK
jgi:putative heme-binding domain-containing protein